MNRKATLISDKKYKLKEEKIYFKSHEEINEAIIHESNIGRLLERFYAVLNLMKLLIAHGNPLNLS